MQRNEERLGNISGVLCRVNSVDASEASAIMVSYPGNSVSSINFLAGTLSVWCTFKYQAMTSCEKGSTGMRTSLSKVGMWGSGHATMPLVPKGVVPCVRFCIAPVVLPVAGVLATGGGAGVCGAGVMSIGECAWGDGTSKRAGEMRMDSPGVSEATILSRRSWAVLRLLDEVASLSVELLEVESVSAGSVALQGVGGKGLLKGGFPGLLLSSAGAGGLFCAGGEGSTMDFKQMFSVNLSSSISRASSSSGTPSSCGVFVEFQTVYTHNVGALVL